MNKGSPGSLKWRFPSPHSRSDRFRPLPPILRALSILSAALYPLRRSYPPYHLPTSKYLGIKEIFARVQVVGRHSRSKTSPLHTVTRSSMLDAQK